LRPFKTIQTHQLVSVCRQKPVKRMPDNEELDWIIRARVLPELVNRQRPEIHSCFVLVWEEFY